MLVEYVEDIGGNGNICLTNRKSTNFLSIYLHRYTLRLQRHWNLGRAGPRQILLFQIRPIFLNSLSNLFSIYFQNLDILAKLRQKQAIGCGLFGLKPIFSTDMKLASLYFREYFMISFENMCQAILPSSTEVGFLPYLNCAQLPKIWLNFYSR